MQHQPEHAGAATVLVCILIIKQRVEKLPEKSNTRMLHRYDMYQNCRQILILHVLYPQQINSDLRTIRSYHKRVRILLKQWLIKRRQTEGRQSEQNRNGYDWMDLSF